MKREKAIEILLNEQKCVERAESCDRNCEKCDLVMDSYLITQALDKAVEALEEQERALFCPLADTLCLHEKRDFIYCLVCPHVKEEDRELIRNLIKDSAKHIKHEFRNPYNDLVKRQDVVEIVQYFTDAMMKEDAYPKLIMLELAFAIALLDEADNEWIPCKEDLPKHPDQVLVTAKGKTVNGYDWYETSLGEYWGGTEGWGDWGDSEIIAWKETPSPYKED